MEACRTSVSTYGGKRLQAVILQSRISISMPEQDAEMEIHGRQPHTFSGQALETLCSAKMAKPAFFCRMAHCKRSVGNAMWYVIQTMTGKEEELRLQLAALLDRQRFRDCFIIRAEWLKRLGGKWEIQVRPLFPGYVFVETGQPEELFLKLKETPGYARVLGNGRYEFTALEEEEEHFLKTICRVGQEKDGFQRTEKRWLVRLSTARPGKAGEGWRIRGPLKAFEKQIARINLHKRYAVVRVTMGRRKQTVLFGLAGDDTIADAGRGAIADTGRGAIADTGHGTIAGTRRGAIAAAGRSETADDTGGTDNGDRAADRKDAAEEKGCAGSGGCI